jgi:hypothetical protein
MKNTGINGRDGLNQFWPFVQKMLKLTLFSLLLWGIIIQDVRAQCNPVCTLDNVGMYMWMGDNDAQSLGDATNDDEDGDDFIVYKNYGTAAVDISGWQLYTDVAGSTTPVFTFPSGTVLQPGQTATVVGDWNAGPALPANWFDANFNPGGEGLFEETSNNVSYAILRNPTTNQYITIHQQGTSSAGQSLASGTKVCNTNVTTLIPADFEGCELVYWDFSTCSYREVTNCSIPQLSACLTGTTAPLLSATTPINTCPATTVDLSTITASNTPGGTTLTWHSATPATTANKLSSVTALAAGTYYAAFYDAGLNCYSNSGAGTTPVTATVITCVTCNAGNTAPGVN